MQYLNGEIHILSVFPTQNNFGLAITICGNGQRDVVWHKCQGYFHESQARYAYIETFCNRYHQDKGINMIVISITGGEAATDTIVCFKQWAEDNNVPCGIFTQQEINSRLPNGLAIEYSHAWRIKLQGMKVSGAEKIPKENAAAASAVVLALYSLLPKPVSDTTIIYPLPTNKHWKTVLCWYDYQVGRHELHITGLLDSQRL